MTANMVAPEDHRPMKKSDVVVFGIIAGTLMIGFFFLSQRQMNTAEVRADRAVQRANAEVAQARTQALADVERLRADAKREIEEVRAAAEEEINALMATTGTVATPGQVRSYVYLGRCSGRGWPEHTFEGLPPRCTEQPAGPVPIVAGRARLPVRTLSEGVETR